MKTKIRHGADRAYQEHLAEQQQEEREAILNGDHASTSEEYRQQVETLVPPMSADECRRSELVLRDMCHLENEREQDWGYDLFMDLISEQAEGQRRRQTLEGYDFSREAYVATVAEYRALVDTLGELTYEEKMQRMNTLILLENLELNRAALAE